MKRTSIAAVRAKLGQIDTFPTPLLSGSRLPLKVVGNEKKGGVGKVPNVHNMSLTAAIDVLFSVNFAVVLILCISVSAPVKLYQ